MPMKKGSTDEAIFQMLYRCNRPTAKSEISANFKGEMSATEIQKSLDSLEKSRRLETKTYGKIKVYLVSQDTFQDEDDGGINKSIAEHGRESEQLRKELAALNSEVESLSNMLSMEQLVEGIAVLTESTAANEARLAGLKDGRQISRKEMGDAAKMHAKAAAALKRVRKLFGELVELLSEGMDMKKSQLFEEIGIEA